MIELIVGSRIGYTKRFYYDQAQAPGVRMTIAGEGIQAHAWKIPPIFNQRSGINAILY